LGESIDHPNGHAVKTLESKETRAQGNDADNAQFSLCCTSTSMPSCQRGTAFFFFRAKSNQEARRIAAHQQQGNKMGELAGA
jgi:hypothetical protein